MKRIKLSFHTLLKLIFGFGVVAATLFLWSFPFGQLLLFVIVCVAIGAYALHKTRFWGNSETTTKSNVHNAVPPPPSNICPACHHALTFIDEYKAWYCFNCREYK